MPVAICPGEEFDYVLKCDRALPKEAQTVFKLRVLSVVQRPHFEAALFAGQFDNKKKLEWKDTSLRACLAGWENFKDPSGNEVVFECEAPCKVWGERVTPPAALTLARIGMAHQAELVDAIANMNRLTEEEAKN